MVNEAKVSLGRPPNGSFYINEYKQVIVPTTASEDYLFAGKYEQPLCFEFEGTVLTGKPMDLQGKPLSRGGTWMGPHPGIPYVLAAGGGDVKYSVRLRPNVEREHKLSNMIGPDAAQAVAARIRSVKGYAGSRFYVNEWHAIFAPIQATGAACETPGAGGLAQSSILLVNTHSPWIADWMPAPEDRRHAERWK